MYEPAPLLDIPEAPVPPGAEADWFVGAGGAKLRAALFTPPGRHRGSVVFSGGRTEPIEKHFETIQDFMDRGFVVLSHDWRGQGLSARELPDRLRGHAVGYRGYLEDFRRLLDAYQDRLPRPWLAVGHSMGGCLTLLALANGEKRFAGAVLSAPMLGLQLGGVSARSAATAARMSVLFGRARRYARGQSGRPAEDDFENNILTHDAKRYARHRAQLSANPDLAVAGATWGWVDFALRASAILSRPERLRAVTAPVEIVTAGEDLIVDNAAQAAAARNLPQGRQVVVPGAYHEILMETDDMRNIFLRVFDALTGKTTPKPASTPKPAAEAGPQPMAAAAPKVAPAPAPKPAPAPTPVAVAPAPVRTAPAKAARAKKPAAKKPAPPKKTPPAGKAAAVKAPAKTAAAKKAPAKPATPKKVLAKTAAAKAPAVKAKAKPAAKKAAPAKAAAKKPAAKAAAAKPAAKTAKPAATKAKAKPAAKRAPARKAPAKKPASKTPA